MEPARPGKPARDPPVLVVIGAPARNGKVKPRGRRHGPGAHRRSENARRHRMARMRRIAVTTENRRRNTGIIAGPRSLGSA